MTWQQELIQHWRHWHNDYYGNAATIIPALPQLGKILEFCFCDEVKALEFIDSQLEEDRNNPYGVNLDDKYWRDVRDLLIRFQINHMIMAD